MSLHTIYILVETFMLAQCAYLLFMTSKSLYALKKARIDRVFRQGKYLIRSCFTGKLSDIEWAVVAVKANII